MGIPLVKIDKNNIKWTQNSTSDYLEKIHSYIVDQEKVGDAFLVILRNEKDNRKITYALITDIAGASDEIYLHGCLLYLAVDEKTNIANYHIHGGPWTRSRFYDIIYLGKILLPPIVNISKPEEWAVQLELLVSKRILRVFNG